jgi:hypothetical protein
MLKIPSHQQSLSKYTRKSAGNRLTWSDEGHERFNDLVIAVFRDRESKSQPFDEEMMQKMKEKCTKKRKRIAPEEGERRKPLKTYSELDVEFIIEHATLIAAPAITIDQNADNMAKIPVTRV